MGALRLFIRAPLLVSVILTSLLLMTLGSLLKRPDINRAIVKTAFTLGSKLLGLRIHLQGKLSPKRPLLLVSNHFSYLDLFAIGSYVPAAFTPKSEIAGWPIIGPLCKMAGCLFIDRRASQTIENKRLLENARQRGEIISLFPEATTNEGFNVLPFKSSYFSLPMETDIAVQPMTVVYTNLNNAPVTRDGLPVIGWYGDMTFFPHLVQFLKQKNADVKLIFHPVVEGKSFPSRKELAYHCWEQISERYKAELPKLSA